MELDAILVLGVEALDQIHAEFSDILIQTQRASAPEFLTYFSKLIEHSKAHFAFEESLMREHNFYGLNEHIKEHQKLLDEMEYFYKKAQKIKAFGRSYIDDYAFESFHKHVVTIDAQLAMFLKQDNANTL